MAMTKKDFAVKLLFWLFPWPISRALPLSLRIYYFGPAGGPPPGFYDYWGIPKWFWEDIPPWEDFIENPPDEEPPWWPPNAPPWEDFIENPPDEEPPWWPIDPYNPPPAEDFPEPPAGPSNPSNPYTPGPGPVNPHPPIPSGFWSQYLDDTYWEGNAEVVWNVDHWDLIGDFSIEMSVFGTWNLGFRPSKFRVTHNYGPGLTLGIIIDSPDVYVFDGVCVSGQEYDLDFSGTKDADMRGLFHDAGEEGCDFDITNIEFYS